MNCWKTICFLGVMCVSVHSFAAQDQNIIPEITESIETQEVVPPPIDEITLKQMEMRNTAVMVRTRNGSGSGTIIDRIETDTEGMFEYIVLTNAHVTYSRFITILRGANSLTGRAKTEVVDSGCFLIIFDHEKSNLFRYNATIIDEDVQYDLALLSFRSELVLTVARLADKDMISKVRVFDNVFAIGCQLGQSPSPTTGIISQIITGNNGEKQWVLYGITSQITPGSSGGGLFKKYGEHYYLIGIPFRALVAGNGQFVSHLAHAISLDVARDFINNNMVTHP